MLEKLNKLANEFANLFKQAGLREVNVSVEARIARRLLAHGRLAMGFPLQDGTWSTEGMSGHQGSFEDGEKVLLRFTSKGGTKVFAEREAIVRDQTWQDSQGQMRGSFMAIFAPMHIPAKTQEL